MLALNGIVDWQELTGQTRFIVDLVSIPFFSAFAGFITKTAEYQRIFEPAAGKRFPQDSWAKTVAPRGPQVTARLTVLVNHWTGSMGEGMAIGLTSSAQAAQTIGAEARRRPPPS